MISIQNFRIRIGLFLNNRVSNKMYRGQKQEMYLKNSKFQLTLGWVKILCILILISSYSQYCQKVNNKLNHSKNGNKSESIKIMHWNKGPSYFKNKIDHLSIILNKYKPNVISLSEANYNISENKDNYTF